ncbi:MAG: DUF1549 domain-containing protein, partial [Planctomycetaceae bacterium]
MACGICLAVHPLLAADQADPSKAAYFEKRVRPLLVNQCLDCHQGESAKNGLEMDTLAGLLSGGLRGPALVPGKAEESLLIRALRHGELLKMPPKTKLPAAEISTIAKWIADGAVWPNAEVVANKASQAGDKQAIVFTAKQQNFWAFQTPATTLVPRGPDSWLIQSPLDAFIRKQLDAQAIESAPRADQYTLIRRATFALTGLPPTPEDTAAFLTDDRPHTFARLVERLLASPRYGERWGRHWLDVIRYADSNGLDENLAYANTFRYRD